MLLRGAISRPLTSSPAAIRLRTTTTIAALPQNVAVLSSQPPPAAFSISDEDLESRGFVLRRSAEELDLDQLKSVFVAVGFLRHDPAKIRIALENTDAMLWIENAKTRKRVAFARATGTGDGVFNAIIWDVVVEPSYQGIGLGKAVMERLVEELREKGISNIALYF